MRILEMADLRDYGKNNLQGLGFALTGFIVTYSVIKACAWVFKDRSEAATPGKGQTKQEPGKIFVYHVLAIGISRMSYELITQKLGLDNETHATNPRILALHGIVLAIASIWDKRKIISLGIGISAASGLFKPVLFTFAGTCWAAYLDMRNRGM